MRRPARRQLAAAGRVQQKLACLGELLYKVARCRDMSVLRAAVATCDAAVQSGLRDVEPVSARLFAPGS